VSINVDQPEERGVSNSHDLLFHTYVVDSPLAVLEALESEVEIMGQEIHKRDANIFTRSLARSQHSPMPQHTIRAGWHGQVQACAGMDDPVKLDERSSQAGRTVQSSGMNNPGKK